MTLLPWRYPDFGPFFVSSSGSDGGGTGTSGNPWRTIQKSADFIRTNNLNQVQLADITVNVLPGTYAGWSMTAADSGCNAHRVIYQPTGAVGSVHISNGTSVTGWSNVGGSIYRAAVATDFHTVYVNGVRARAARFPKLVINASYPTAKAPYFLAQNNGSSFTELQYNPIDVTPDAWGIANLEAVVGSGGSWNWLTDTNQVIARNTVAKTFTFGASGKFFTYKTAGSRYFLQNALEILTEAGEYYFDRVNGFLYMFGDPAGSDVVVSSAVEAITLNGTSPARPIKNITIDGFTVENTDFIVPWRLGYPSNGAGTIFGPPHTDAFYAYWDSIATARRGAITIKDSDGVKVTRCHLNNIGSNGIYVGGYGRNLEVSQSLIENVGVSGIVQEGRYSGEGDIIGGSLFYSLRVKNMGQLAAQATGIQIGNSGTNSISRCEFSDAPRHGTWLYGSFGQPFANVYTKGNTIDRCSYRRLTQDTGDTAGCYIESVSSVSGSGNYNVNTFSQLIIDVCRAHPLMTDVAPNGVFTDNETAGQVFQNVQVTNTDGNQYRTNGSLNMTLTNTSFLATGLPNGAFNAGLMDTANIGVAAGFPY